MELEVIWASGSPYSWSVLLTLEVKELQYKSTLIELFKGENRTPEFLKMNPRGKVPVLRDGDYFIYESLAIISYLDRKFMQESLFGETPEQAAQIMKMISEYQSYIAPHVGEIMSLVFWRNDLLKNIDQLTNIRQNLHDELNQLELYLDGNNWVIGNNISAADICIFPFMQILLRAESKIKRSIPDFDLLLLDKSFPSISKWLKMLETLPGYEKTYPPHWREHDNWGHFIS